MLHVPQDITSGATPANLLVASMAVKPFSSTYLRAGIGVTVIFLKSQLMSCVQLSVFVTTTPCDHLYIEFYTTHKLRIRNRSCNRTV